MVSVQKNPIFCFFNYGLIGKNIGNEHKKKTIFGGGGGNFF